MTIDEFKIEFKSINGNLSKKIDTILFQLGLSNVYGYKYWSCLHSKNKHFIFTNANLNNRMYFIYEKLTFKVINFVVIPENIGKDRLDLMVDLMSPILLKQSISNFLESVND